jgi:hypothetical protein
MEVAARNLRGVRTKADEIASVVARSWCKDTSYDPKGWSTRNRAWGQCAITALIVQDLLGGRLLRAQVNGHEHYWNLLPDTRELDLTREQFGGAPEVGSALEVSRDYVLSFPDTVRRYQRLRELVERNRHSAKGQLRDLRLGTTRRSIKRAAF